MKHALLIGLNITATFADVGDDGKVVPGQVHNTAQTSIAGPTPESVAAYFADLERQLEQRTAELNAQPDPPASA